MGQDGGGEIVNDGTQQQEHEGAATFDDGAWEALLEILAPTGIMEVMDVTGHKHVLSTTVPAAVQLQLARTLGRLYALPAGNAVAGALSEARGAENRLAGLAIAVNALLQDEETGKTLERLLSDAFALAHPKVTQRALDNVYAHEDFRLYAPEKREDATILYAFEITDIVRGLLPFGAGVARKALPAVRHLMALGLAGLEQPDAATGDLQPSS